MFLGAHVFARSNMCTRPKYLITTGECSSSWSTSSVLSSYMTERYGGSKQEISRNAYMIWKKTCFSAISHFFAFLAPSPLLERTVPGTSEVKKQWLAANLVGPWVLSPHSSPLPTCWTSEVQINWIPNLKSSKVKASTCFTLFHPPRSGLLCQVSKTDPPTTVSFWHLFIFSPPQSGGIPARS